MHRSLRFAAVFCMLLLLSHGVLANSPSGSSLLSQDWADLAIEELGRDRGIPDFDIPAQPNRNQRALLVARLLQHLSGEDHLQSRRFGVSKNVYLDNMIFTYNQRVVPEMALTVSQVEALYRLVLEFSDELEILGYAIQDFNLLQSEGFVEQQEGPFANRNLLYSEQALSAARKRDEQRTAVQSVEVVAAPETSIAEIIPEPVRPRNLWTGQFSPVTRTLPPSSSIVAQESLAEQSRPLSLGGFEVTTALRPAPSGSQSSIESSSSSTAEGGGYGIALRMGDVALRTDLALNPEKVSTSVDLSWAWADLFTLSAGYRQGLRLKEDAESEDEAPVVASLGVVVPLNRGQVHLGMTQEWNFADLEGNPMRPGELGMGTSTAELELSYDLKNDSSLRFNYRFIDFSNMESGTEAEAAFSIKF